MHLLGSLGKILFGERGDQPLSSTPGIYVTEDMFPTEGMVRIYDLVDTTGEYTRTIVLMDGRDYECMKKLNDLLDRIMTLKGHDNDREATA